jgi:cysteine-rich repeat protein
MRFRTIAIATALAAGLGASVNAYAPHQGSERPVVAAGRAPRAHRTVGYSAPAKLAPQMGTFASWQQIWDRDTDVPLRMWGPSIPFFGSTASSTVAESAALQFLAQHLALLAPGATASDFTILSNVVDRAGTIRTVGFQQTSNGLPVAGATIGLTFERDHLVMVSSTAVPNVVVRMPVGAMLATNLERSAQDFLSTANISTHVLRHGDRAIVPIIHERGTKASVDIEYRVVDTVTVEADRGAGQWDVWLDANDGSAIARKSNLMFASGSVLFDVPDRGPQGTRSAKPAPNDNHTVNGALTTSAADGTVSWTGATATVAPGLSGALVKVTNLAGANITDSLSLADAGSVTWSKASDGPSDAQLDAFVFISTAKAFVTAKLNPSASTSAFLGMQNVVSVNMNDKCNAFSTGEAEFFFLAGTAGSDNCENTGRISDVVYHEFGHSIHFNSIIPGEGVFDGSLSEGMADTMAVSITGDHAMGKGFFVNLPTTALRDVDPVGLEKSWPADADGEVHDEGEIIGEALYDTRKALQAKYGDADGFNKFLVVYYNVMERAADIPSSFPAALVGNDDDGDLSNGTPDQCEIQTAFALHGLTTTAGATSALLGIKPPTLTGNTVALSASAATPNPACPLPTIVSATLTWALQGGTKADVPLAFAAGAYTGDIPTQPSGSVIRYHVTVTLSDNTTMAFPDNKADPDYQTYVGAVTQIQCFDFEGGIGDWTHSGTTVHNAPADEWEAGMPLGIGGDPRAAHGGNNVLGQDLGDGTVGDGDGDYLDGGKSWAISPAIDLKGFTHVRLQYYRWLGVEDGAYDQATIFANTMPVWTNLTSPGDPQNAEINHIDKEWRFADVDLTPAITAAMPMTLKFEVDADGGLDFAGWNLDDVCIVGTADPALCGNGTVDLGETCDDGNKNDGDGCSSSCQTEMGSGSGPGGVNGGGCCSAGTKPAGALVLSLFTIGLVLRRRRRK